MVIDRVRVVLLVVCCLVSCMWLISLVLKCLCLLMKCMCMLCWCSLFILWLSVLRNSFISVFIFFCGWF